MKELLILGESSLDDTQRQCRDYLEERGLNIRQRTSYEKIMKFFDVPIADVCGIILFPLFTAITEENFMTIRGPIGEDDLKKIRSVCRKQRIPLIEINSFDGSDAVKKKIKTWLRIRVFRG